MDRSATGDVEVGGGIWKYSDHGNWKLALEGSNEGYHPDFLHKASRLVAEQITTNGGASARPYDRNSGFGNSSAAGIDLGNGHSVMGSGGQAFNANWRNAAPKEYVEAIVARLGEDRARQVLGTNWRMNVFPNVCFATNEIRVIRPIAVNAYEFVQYHAVVPGMTASQQRSAIQRHQGFHGQAGYGRTGRLRAGEPDEGGYRSSDLKSLNKWARFTRGLGSETRGPNGERFGPVNTEVEQRAN